jgi:hypothetical protein
MRRAAPVLAALILAAALAATGERGPQPAAAQPKPKRFLIAQVTGFRAVVGFTDVRLRWRARARRENNWRLVRNGHTVRLGRAARTYLDRGLTPGKRYRYRLRGCRDEVCGRAHRLTVRTRAVKAPGTVGTSLAGCPIFPKDNAWNRDVSLDPVHPDSAAFIESIGLSEHLHPDFGSGRLGNFGIPYDIVPAGQAKVPIRFTAYASESDPGPYPVPAGARVEGGSDRHVVVLSAGECRLYELYRAQRSGDGWEAESGAVFNLRSNALRPAGWTSADAAGLPIFPGLARADEVASGAITHALRFTVARTQRGYISPARHWASDSTNRTRPPMGLRVRLRGDFDLSGFGGQAKVILQALKTYGMIVADNGSDWFLSGAPDPAWNDDDLEQLKRVPGRAFEAVDTGPVRTR